MPSTLEPVSHARVKLTVEIPFADLTRSITKAYREIADQVSVPGFRRGKVPPAVIDRRFGRDVVLQQAIDDEVPGAYQEAVKEHSLAPLGGPEVEVTRIEDGELVEFTAEVDVRPDFELPDLSQIKVEVPAATVADEDVDAQIDMLRRRFATLTPQERPAEKGDVLVIGLRATRDGEDLPDGSASNITYRVGEGGMLDGLDEAVVGLSAGESKTFASTLVGGVMAGEEADIEVTVSKVSAEVLPVADDEFASLVSEFDTMDEMRADLREALLAEAKVRQLADARDAVLAKVIEEVGVELPAKTLEDEVAGRREAVTNQLAQAGLSLERYLADADDEPDTPEEFWEKMRGRAEDALRGRIVLDKASEQFEVRVSESDLTELLVRKAQQNRTTPQEEADHMMEHGHMNEWLEEIRRGKAVSRMVSLATVVDSSGVEIAPSADGAEAAGEEAPEEE